MAVEGQTIGSISGCGGSSHHGGAFLSGSRLWWCVCSWTQYLPPEGAWLLLFQLFQWVFSVPNSFVWNSFLSLFSSEFRPYLIIWWSRFLPLAIPQAKGSSTCILSFTDFSFHFWLKGSCPSLSWKALVAALTIQILSLAHPVIPTQNVIYTLALLHVILKYWY